MEFLIFFLISNGVTVLQLALMPIVKNLLAASSLVDINFQVMPIGRNPDGSRYYIFDYMKGALADGGGGGLAYFLAVQSTLLAAQVINFFLQRKITFKSDTDIRKAITWYAVAYVIITIAAAAAQGIYKAPIYHQFITVWKMGKTGETIADVITMVINSIISFWVFYPVLKMVFRKDKPTAASES